MLFGMSVVTCLVACQAASMGAFVTVSELSDLLNGTGVSARQAAEKAEAMGIHLPYGSIAAYWSGKHPQRPSEPTLEGLAEVLGLSLRRLRRAAGAAAGETTPWHPPPEANRLTQRQRRALELLIKSIVSSGIDEPQPTVAEIIGIEAPGVHGADHREQRKQL